MYLVKKKLEYILFSLLQGFLFATFERGVFNDIAVS